MKKLLIPLMMLLTLPMISQVGESRLYSIRNRLQVLKVESKGFDEPLNINITETTLSNFLLAIAKVHGLNINVSPELSGISIVNNFSDVSVEDILIFLVKEYDLDIDFTGNILSIAPFREESVDPSELPVGVDYSVSDATVTFDLRNEKLERVFRKVMDETGRNLLFSPELGNLPLTMYLKRVPLETGLRKLADANGLLMEISPDGFYLFESAALPADGEGPKNTKGLVRRNRTNFYYRVLDTLGRRVDVDLRNTPIADVVYALGQDLKLDIFTASPLDNAGVVTVEAKGIGFDLLLTKIFESAVPGTNGSNGQEGPERFTFKKDGNIYYFGTEGQLSLKQVELVTMKHRSVILLENPSGDGRSGNRNNGIANYGLSQFQNNNITTGVQDNRNNRADGNRDRESGAANEKSIGEIIPDDILSGIDIKVDRELNSFVVSGPGIKVERFKDFIASIDRPVPVILIEVMILEVNKSAITETGISFGIGDAPTATRGEFFPSGNVTLGRTDVNKIIGNFNGFGALNIGKVVPNFYLDIKAMEAAGTVKIKSEPKLTTINGHRAYLSNRETTFYAVTSQTFFGSQIPSTSEIRNYYPIDAELALTIQPFVSGDGQITLDIEVIQSAFTGDRIAEDAPPGTTSREFSSIVRMEDRDVVILGGIESILKDDSGSGVPFLARIPVIKWFFSKRRREASKRELNVVIKPTIIE